jgi:hypothetical protein
MGSRLTTASFAYLERSRMLPKPTTKGVVQGVFSDWV